MGKGPAYMFSEEGIQMVNKCIKKSLKSLNSKNLKLKSQRGITSHLWLTGAKDTESTLFLLEHSTELTLN